jgi:predicted O-methyltransferase YrrM
VDFVFIDADHEYDSVVKDINAWLPKIKQGGIISGHDYFNPCGVKKAVDEKFGNEVKFNGPCWYVEL